MLEINKENFDKEVKESDKPVIVDFWAEWCGPCRMLAPMFEELSEEFNDKMKFAKFNTEEDPQFAGSFGISGIPCLIIFNKGEEIDRIVGVLPMAQLREKVNKILDSI